jgi:hypothetical protein
MNMTITMIDVKREQEAGDYEQCCALSPAKEGFGIQSVSICLRNKNHDGDHRGMFRQWAQDDKQAKP